MALTAKKVYAILKRQISDMEAKLNSPVRYRGTVATADFLPLNPDIGDMYNIESKSIYGEAGMNVAWNGVVWDTMGAPIDMSLYFTKEEADAVIQRLVTEYFEKNPVKPGATAEQAQQIEQNKTDIGSLKTETGSLKEDLVDITNELYGYEFNLPLNDRINGYYYGEVGSQVIYAEESGSTAYSIDITPYIGKQIICKYTTTNTESGRITAVCDSSNIILDEIKEKDMINSTTGFVFTVTPKMRRLVISFSSSGNNPIATYRNNDGLIKTVDNKLNEEDFYGYKHDITVFKWTYGSTRLDDNWDIKHGDVTITFSNKNYYYFAYSFNKDGTAKETSETWKQNDTISFKDVYNLAITVKKGSEGIELFTQDDILAVKEDLNINVSFFDVRKEIYSIKDGTLSTVSYVSKSGSDNTGDGSSSNPFATITRALKENDTVIIKNGVYTQSVIIDVRKNISIIKEPNDDGTVVISTSSEHVLTILNSTGIRIDGIVFNGADSDVVYIDKTDGIYIQNCQFNNSKTKDGLEIMNSSGVIYSCKACENYNDGFNINMYGDTVFINCDGVNNIHGDGISHHLGCTGSIISGYWHGNGKAGISSPTYGANVQISGAFCYNNAYGIQAYGGDKVVENAIRIQVNNCVLKDNTIAGIQVDKYIVDLVNCKFVGNKEDKLIVSGTVNEF